MSCWCIVGVALGSMVVMPCSIYAQCTKVYTKLYIGSLGINLRLHNTGSCADQVLLVLLLQINA